MDVIEQIAPETIEKPKNKKTVGVPGGMPFRFLSDPKNRNEQVIRRAKKVTKQPPDRPPIKRKRKASQPRSQVLDEVNNSTDSVLTASDTDSSTELNAPQKHSQTKTKVEAPSELEQLVADAKSGNPTGIQGLRSYLEEHPEIFRRYGDLARAARYGWAKLAAGDSPLQLESLFRRAEELMARYTGDKEICETEQILIEQIVVCSMRLNYFDFQSANYAESENTKLVTLMLRKHESAQNQLYKAISQLETFRRLGQL